MENKEQSYQHALDYIYSFIDYSLTRNLRFSPEKFNLDRVFNFMHLLGNPQNDYKIIHVAGTKGKGSTCAMLTSILTQAGYKTGFYSSPHLIDFTERFQIGSQPISTEKLVKCVDYIKPFVAKVKDLTTFEIITGIAMLYFSQELVDFAVLEVGLGGRLDATNIVTPLISVITSVSRDHMKVLGSTIDKIAREKAGIIKSGVPVVTAKQKKKAEVAIAAVALEKKSELIVACDQVKIERKKFSLEGQYFSVTPLDPNNKLLDDSLSQSSGKDIFLPLLGDHQLENAATAITVIQQLEEMGYHVSFEKIQEGFAQIKWPGRFEIISRDPLIIVDSAHNCDSFRKFKATIDTYIPNKERTLIFGVSEDKEVELMLSIIRPSIDKLIITQADHPRALDCCLIEKYARKLGINYVVTDKVENGFQAAMAGYTEGSVLLAAGSIFIAGEMKETWRSYMERNKQ